MRAGPVETPAGGHNPADARFDPFWSRVAEAGITAAYHSGDSGYLRFFEAWGLGGEFQSFDFNPLRLCMSPAPIMDTMRFTQARLDLRLLLTPPAVFLS